MFYCKELSDFTYNLYRSKSAIIEIMEIKYVKFFTKNYKIHF